jgi:hypothetical protein
MTYNLRHISKQLLCHKAKLLKFYLYSLKKRSKKHLTEQM